MSKFCTNCGSEIEDGQVCQCQEAGQPVNNFSAAPPPPQAPYQPQNNQQPNYSNQQPMTQPGDNRKIYKILSYIGILWLVGIFVHPENTDPKVRFHVGQGIILSIVEVAGSIVFGILGAILQNVFTTRTSFYGYNYITGISPAYGIIMGLLWFAFWVGTIALSIIGIINVTKDIEKPLPIIGKFSFFK
ncbi:MAG: hypothetical protein WC677_04190 [Clostridia bacterium]|jgi:hypothetical protein